MNQLEQKLREKAELKQKQLNEVVTDAKALLASNDAAERELLARLGLDKERAYYEEHQVALKVLRQETEEYGFPVVTRAELRDLCMRYRLFMRKTNEYKGRIPTDLGPELVRYVKEKNINVSGGGYHPFYILAPPNMFKEYKNPLSRAIDTVGQVSEERRIANEAARARFIAEMRDPILVMQIGEHNGADDDHFAICRSWGEIDGFKRRLYGLATSRLALGLFSFVMAMLPVLVAIVACLGVHQLFTHFGMATVTKVVENELVTGMSGWYVLALLVYALAAIGSLIHMFHPHGVKGYVRKHVRSVSTHHRWKP